MPPGMRSHAAPAPLLPSQPGSGWLRHATPEAAYRIAGRALPWCWGVAVIAALAGLGIGLVLAPADGRQGDLVRIVFVHVPAAWLSMGVYVVMAACFAVGLVAGARVASMLAAALAPTGALVTFLALWTGALWGKPAWGAWWVWDARLTSELLLLFLYLGVIALHAAIDDPLRADRAAVVLAVVGVINVPIIVFSVQWWQTLHQAGGVGLLRSPSLPGATFAALLLAALALAAWCAAAALHRLRSMLLERERDSDWARALPEAAA